MVERPTSSEQSVANLPPVHLTASLTTLYRMVSHVASIHDSGDRELDRRLAVVIDELDSLIVELQPDAGRTTGSAAATRIASSGGARGSRLRRAEAAFEAWLSSDDKPDLWQVDAPGQPRTPLTGLLGELVTSGRQLPPRSAAALGMPPGTTLGHAATELLLAVTDATGPRCRSYRSALFYLRDHDATFAVQ